MASRIELIDRDVQLIKDELLSPAAQSGALAAMAAEYLAEADDTNLRALGHPVTSHTYVDGREGVPLASVRADGGVIIREYNLLQEAVQWIMQELRLRSPRLTGRYSKSHVLYADGTLVLSGSPVPPDADRYVILSTTPYARKIEGVGGREPESRQAPDGVYEVTAKEASRMFGNAAKISFSFESPLSGAIADWAATSSARRMAGRIRGGNRARHTAWLTRVPAIVITAK